MEYSFRLRDFLSVRHLCEVSALFTKFEKIKFRRLLPEEFQSSHSILKIILTFKTVEICNLRKVLREPRLVKSRYFFQNINFENEVSHTDIKFVIFLTVRG